MVMRYDVEPQVNNDHMKTYLLVLLDQERGRVEAARFFSKAHAVKTGKLIVQRAEKIARM